jgi:phage tail-like protein
VSAVDRDPYFANNFEVDLGAGAIGFAEVSGVGYEIDYVDDPDTVKPASQPTKRVVARVTAVSLRRGVTADLSVWRWVHAAVDGSYEPRTVTIRLLDAQRAPVCAWVLRGARPIRWLGPNLSALGTAVAIEELVLAADSIDFSAT